MCAVRTNLEGRNWFNFLPDSPEGTEDILRWLNELQSQGDQITIALDKLGVPVSGAKSPKIWQTLAAMHADSIYEFETHSAGESGAQYYVDSRQCDPITESENADVAILLSPPGTQLAFYMFWRQVSPPVDPIAAATFGCEALTHSGLTRYMLTTGAPPSPRDIEHLIKGELKIGMVLSGNAVFIMLKTDRTRPAMDTEDFYLTHGGVLTRYKMFPDLIASKIAVLELCAKFGLAFACGSLHSNQLEETAGEKSHQLIGDSDYIIPSELVRLG